MDYSFSGLEPKTYLLEIPEESNFSNWKSVLRAIKHILKNDDSMCPTLIFKVNNYQNSFSESSSNAMKGILSYLKLNEQMDSINKVLINGSVNNLFHDFLSLSDTVIYQSEKNTMDDNDKVYGLKFSHGISIVESDSENYLIGIAEIENLHILKVNGLKIKEVAYKKSFSMAA